MFLSFSNCVFSVGRSLPLSVARGLKRESRAKALWWSVARLCMSLWGGMAGSRRGVLFHVRGGVGLSLCPCGHFTITLRVVPSALRTMCRPFADGLTTLPDMS